MMVILKSSISNLFLFFLLRLDEELTNNEDLNTDIVDTLKKEFDAMLPSFEEHLKKKYPSFVSKIFILIKLKMFIAFIEQIILSEQFIIIK